MENIYQQQGQLNSRDFPNAKTVRFVAVKLHGLASFVFIGFIDLLLEPTQFLSTQSGSYCFHFDATQQNENMRLGNMESR